MWVGGLKDATGKEKMDPYIPMAKNATISCSQFTVMTTEVISNKNGCNTYEFEVSIPSEGKKRQVSRVFMYVKTTTDIFLFCR